MSQIHPLTDLGNGYRIVDRGGAFLRYCPSQGRWYVWDGARWKPDERGQVTLLAKQTMLNIFVEARDCADPKQQKEIAMWAWKSQSLGRMTAAVRMAESELPVTPGELDANPMLLNVLNGTLDLRTGQLRPQRQEDLITKLAPVEFQAGVDCPRWRQFMVEITAGNKPLAAYIQRLLGHCLTGDVSEQILPIFYGDGGNGKNVLLDTTMGLMGDYAGSAAPSLLLMSHNSEHPTEIADLFGKRLVVASESEEGGRLKLQVVKRLTGDRTLKARYMRQDYFEFQRTHKTVFVTNNKPIVRENTRAAWRRIRLVPFTVAIPHERQDKHLTAKLRDEWPGILNWCIAGCLEWQRDGLREPPAVDEATATYRREQDLLADFISSTCIIDLGLKEERGAIYSAYVDWTKANRERSPLDRPRFYEHLRKGGVDWPPLQDGDSKLTDDDGATRTAHVFRGIGLDPQAVEANRRAAAPQRHTPNSDFPVDQPISPLA